MKHVIYLIGSLRNPEVPKFAQILRGWGHEVFDDWYAAGPEADDKWRDYEKSRGHTYIQALDGYAANHVFHFDKAHIMRCEIGVLMLPAGKSGHMELGYMMGLGKKGFILLDNPERWDVMYKFADGVFDKPSDLMFAIDNLNPGFCHHGGGQFSDSGHSLDRRLTIQS